jgi:hypothetical protein
MIDPSPHEMLAMEHASDAAGEYIESLRQTDMAAWSKAQWASFIETVCGAYVDSLCKQQAEINDAFRKAMVQ